MDVLLVCEALSRNVKALSSSKRKVPKVHSHGYTQVHRKIGTKAEKENLSQKEEHSDLDEDEEKE